MQERVFYMPRLCWETWVVLASCSGARALRGTDLALWMRFLWDRLVFLVHARCVFFGWSEGIYEGKRFECSAARVSLATGWSADDPPPATASLSRRAFWTLGSFSGGGLAPFGAVLSFFFFWLVLWWTRSPVSGSSSWLFRSETLFWDRCHIIQIRIAVIYFFLLQGPIFWVSDVFWSLSLRFVLVITPWSGSVFGWEPMGLFARMPFDDYWFEY